MLKLKCMVKVKVGVKVYTLVIVKMVGFKVKMVVKLSLAIRLDIP